MKVIIAGSRSIHNYKLVEQAVQESGFTIDEIVSGGAYGVDALGEHYSFMHDIPLRIFKADWDRYGKGAGFKRNYDMADYADALIAIWDGTSHGTDHMIHTAEAYNLKTYVKNLALTPNLLVKFVKVQNYVELPGYRKVENSIKSRGLKRDLYNER